MKTISNIIVSFAIVSSAYESCSRSFCDEDGIEIEGIPYCCPDGGLINIEEDVLTCGIPQLCNKETREKADCYLTSTSQSYINAECPEGYYVQVYESIINLRSGPSHVEDMIWANYFTLNDGYGNYTDYMNILASNHRKMLIHIVCDKSFSFRCEFCFAYPDLYCKLRA